MILIVSDTSAIRALAYLRCLEFLPQLFDKVIIPVAVNEELIHPPSKFQSIDVKDFGFIEVRSPSDPDGVSSLIADLDTGEAEAIALAIVTFTSRANSAIGK